MRYRMRIAVDGPVAKVKGWEAHRLTLEAGLRPIYVIDGWTFDTKRLPDLLALLDRRRITYELTDADQFELFGGGDAS